MSVRLLFGTPAGQHDRVVVGGSLDQVLGLVVPDQAQVVVLAHGEQVGGQPGSQRRPVQSREGVVVETRLQGRLGLGRLVGEHVATLQQVGQGADDGMGLGQGGGHDRKLADSPAPRRGH